MIDYSEKALRNFNAPKHIYDQSSTDLFGYAGDTSIGEFVNFYFNIDKAEIYANTRITRATFSAIGGVLTIAAAETFCSLVEGITFQDALRYCDMENGLRTFLSAPTEKIYSINFVIQAFYKAFETLMIS